MTWWFRSEEVKKELPEDTARFAGIDTDVKRVLTDFFADKNAAIAYARHPTRHWAADTRHQTLDTRH